LLGKSHSLNNFPKYIIGDNNDILTDEISMATSFNIFYTNVAHDLVSKIELIHTDKTVHSFMSGKNHIDNNHANNSDTNINKNTTPFFFTPPTITDVYKLLCNIKPHKAIGIDNIHPLPLRDGAYYLAAPLSYIIHLSFLTCTFPNRLKTARVTPLFKKGDPHLRGNYRPVSVLPQFSKIVETIMYQQILHFFHTHNRIISNQYGFQAGVSTIIPLLNLVHDLFYHMDAFARKHEKQVGLNILLDLAKAFDTVDHNILLLKLEHLGVHGSALFLLRSYLSNRTQCVKINAYYSPPSFDYQGHSSRFDTWPFTFLSIY